MGQLGDKQIKDTYDGIIKTQDEGPISSTPKRLQDGLGNNLPVDVTTAKMRYYGEQDFTNAIVTGITGGGGAGVTYTLTVTDPDPLNPDEAYLNLIGSDGSTSTFRIDAGTNIKIDVDTFLNKATINGASYTLEAYQSGANAGLRLLKDDLYFDDVMLIAGTGVTLSVDGINDTITINASGGGGGGLENYNGYPWAANTQGYGDTYGITSQNLNSEIYWNSAVDQGPGTAILGKLFVQPGVAITKLITPFLSVVSDDVYEFAIYDTYDSGVPKDKVFNTTITVTGSLGDQYVETNISWTPTKNRYWFALRSDNADLSKIGIFNRNAFQNTYFTYGAWGSTPVGMLAVNSLYYNSTLPSSFDEDQEYGHRDEGPVIIYKH